VGTPFFDPSPQGLPFGPRKSHTPEEAHALRDPEVRLAHILEGASDPLEYVQALGFGAFAKVNAAPAGDEHGPLPARSANPYAGVGTPIQLHLRWLDIFGNQIVSAFGAPPPGYTGPMDDLPVPITYSDRIVGLSQWPNVRPDYFYGGTPGAPQITLELQFEPAAYDDTNKDWLKTAKNDLKTLTAIYFQINQDYDTVSVPGLSGQAISMSLENTLLAEPEVPLQGAQAQQVRDFVSQCLTYVWNRVQGNPGGAVPSASLVVPLAVGQIATDDVIPMSLSFTLTRQAALTDPALRAIPGGLTDTTQVMARTSTRVPPPADAAAGSQPTDTPVSLEQFASEAETVLVTDAWQLRVGTSAAAPSAGGVDGQSLWAVRMATQPGQGLGYDIGRGASFYAPKPLAVALRNGPASIGTYATGKPFQPATEQLTFAGVDMNAWAQQALAAIDAFLTPTYASPALLVDQLLVTDEPEKNGYLAKILAHKEKLASAIARTVKPVLESSLDDPASCAAASDKLEQALLSELSAAYTVTAVTVFPVTAAKARQPLAPGVVSPPRFYGQPEGKPATNTVALTENGTPPAGQSNFALSTAKVPLTTSDDGTSHLAFLFSSKSTSIADQAFVPLELTYVMSHLEHDIENVPGIDGYEQSRWIKFLTRPHRARLLPASGTVVRVPVVLRALPQPPSVTSQTAGPTYKAHDGRPLATAGETPDKLARWDYDFSYLYRAAAQDNVSAKVEFNRGTVGLETFADPSQALFGALAQFVTLEPAIAADFESNLRTVDGRSKATDLKVTNSGFALAAFEAIVGAVATAYDDWAGPAKAVATVVRGPEHIVYEFDIGLVSGTGGNARVDIYADPKAVPPAPVVQIGDGTYSPQAVTPVAPAVYAWEYSMTDKAGKVTWLDYATARDNPSRTVGYHDLDVFARQDGYATIHVVRNARLAPDSPTTGTFQFSTPDVKFADRIVPLLAYPGYDLGSLEKASSPLATYLADFFTSLLSSAEGQAVAVKMSSGYSFRIVPGSDLPVTVLPIHLLPPTPMTPGSVPPFVAAVSDAVDTWLSTHARPDDPGAEVTFGLELFAGGGLEQKPLLTIADLHVDVSALTGA
jgi:hypothetical protein